MGIDRESEISADLQIGPTTLGMVRIYVVAEGVDLPLDFDPEEADEIAEELRAAAERARNMTVRARDGSVVEKVVVSNSPRRTRHADPDPEAGATADIPSDPEATPASTARRTDHSFRRAEAARSQPAGRTAAGKPPMRKGPPGRAGSDVGAGAPGRRPKDAEGGAGRGGFGGAHRGGAGKPDSRKERHGADEGGPKGGRGFPRRDDSSQPAGGRRPGGNAPGGKGGFGRGPGGKRPAGKGPGSKPGGRPGGGRDGGRGYPPPAHMCPVANASVRHPTNGSRLHRTQQA